MNPISSEDSWAEACNSSEQISPTHASLLSEDIILQTLEQGAIDEKTLLPYSSNYSFLVTVTHDGLTIPAVYKPQQGENPLWDFETGTLCKREVAAYVVSRELGWQLVPPTILRKGDYGLGSVQFYIEHDENYHYFVFQSDARFVHALHKLALFDFIVNNADRKSGHCLVDVADQIWAIDHGICFHAEYKLRTVIWEFSDEEISAELYRDLSELYTQISSPHSAFSQDLGKLINHTEQTALRVRLEQLLETKAYPAPSPYYRNHPWPPI